VLQVVKSKEAPILHPGKNSVLISLPPQPPGSYVLGVLTGQIGDVKLRSHTYCSTSAASCKGGPPDSDDHLSSEKPLRPVLEVFGDYFCQLVVLRELFRMDLGRGIFEQTELEPLVSLTWFLLYIIGEVLTYQ
jgi:hypothetical protein